MAEGEGPFAWRDRVGTWLGGQGEVDGEARTAGVWGTRPVGKGHLSGMRAMYSTLGGQSGPRSMCARQPISRLVGDLTLCNVLQDGLTASDLTKNSEIKAMLAA